MLQPAAVRRGWAALGVLALVATSLTGCHRAAVQSSQPGAAFAFQTDDRIGVVREHTVVSELTRGARTTLTQSIRLTKDGRFIYSAGDKSIVALDTNSLEEREIPCSGMCRYHPLGASLIGRFDPSASKDTQNGETDRAVVTALDLAQPEPTLATLGQVTLARAYPAYPKMRTYSYFLDAVNGQYLFLDFVPDPNFSGDPTRIWEAPQSLYLAKLDGRTENLGRYAGYANEADVWGALSPNGRFAVLNSDAELTGPSPGCTYRPLDLIDTGSGRRTQIHPSPPAAGPQSLRISRAWWGEDGTLYADYRQWACDPHADDGSSAPSSVWRYRNGEWTELDTHGPAIYALPLADGRIAVVEPTAGQQDSDVPRGALSVVDPDGARTHIADDVTAIAPVPAGR